MDYHDYVLSNFTNSVVYTGVTNDLVRRVYEHREKLVEGFTKRYDVWKLVYFEATGSIESAILREKQIKSWSRLKKNALVAKENPTWRGLWDDISVSSWRLKIATSTSSPRNDS